MKRKLLTYFSVILVSLVSTSISAQMYISEVSFAPDDDFNQEFIEIRGTASSTIPDDTYLLFVEGDGNTDFGNTKMHFDLSGLTFGSNGYLVIVQEGHPYTPNASATVVVAPDDTGVPDTGWELEPSYTGSGSSGATRIEDRSMNIMLVTLPDDIFVVDSGDGRPDIDEDDDGDIDDEYLTGIDAWTFHDGISILDNDDAAEYAYTSTVFAQDLDLVVAPTGAYLYETSFGGGYVARIGESTGSTGNDWLCVGASSSTAWGLSTSSWSDEVFEDVDLIEVGGPSYVATTITYSGGALVPADVDVNEDLVITSNFSTSDDFEFHDLTVNSGITLTISDAGSMKVGGGLTNNGTIVVESGGTLWTYSSKESDPVTIERSTTYSDGRYSFVGSPVESDPSITGSDLGPISYYHDETADFDTDAGLLQWNSASAVALEPGVGYAQANQELISLTGVPNNGTIEVPVTNTVASSTTVGNRGFNLVSNPYPSAIEASDGVDEFLDVNTNIDGTIYLWDDGGSDDGRRTNADYITANSAGYVSGGSDRILNGATPRYEGDIRSFQAFFVHVPDNGVFDVATTVTFSEDMRQTGNNNDGRFFREADEEPLNIKLAIQSKDEAFYNETLIAFREDATISKDRMYDALKFGGNVNLQLYSFIDDEKLAIQGLPIENGVSAELGFDLGESSDLVLSVKEMNGLPSDMSFFILDRVTGETFVLDETSAIEFSAEAGFDQNRFILTYDLNSVLGSLSEIDQPLYRYTNSELLVDFNKSIQIEEYIVYDVSGKIISESSVAISTQELKIPISREGINIVQIVTEEGTFIRKFLF